MSTRGRRASPGGTPRRPASTSRPGRRTMSPGASSVRVGPDGALSTKRASTPQVWRLAGVALIAVLLGVFLTPTVSGYLQQRRQIAELEQQIETQRQDITDLGEDVAQWDNPDFIERQARQRLRFVRPGETAFTVLDDTGELLTQAAPGMAPVSKDVHELRPWYGEVWESVKVAGQGAAEPDVDP